MRYFNIKKSDLIDEIEATKVGRTKWDKAVKEDAIDLLTDMPDEMPSTSAALHDLLLNGAETWEQYSQGGCALVYDGDIAAHYMTKSEFFKAEKRDFAGYDLIGMQARALRQAYMLVKSCAARVAARDPRNVFTQEVASRYSERTSDRFSFSEWENTLQWFAEEYQKLEVC